MIFVASRQFFPILLDEEEQNTVQYALKVFETEDKIHFRIIDRDGEPWFSLNDVCHALEIINVSDSAQRLDADEKNVLEINTDAGFQKLKVINESGLYSLILTSRKPSAKKFKKWVTSEVLPSIRKTGGYGQKLPSFIARFNANADRVDPGYFSVINELVVRLWGRLELLGYVMPDKSLSGKEIRPDISVGKGFAKWLNEYHPEAANDHIDYIHWTPKADVLARQYPVSLLPLYLEYVDSVWIPKCAAEYFRTRDPSALFYLPKLLPDPNKPKSGMMRRPTLRTLKRRSA